MRVSYMHNHLLQFYIATFTTRSITIHLIDCLSELFEVVYHTQFMKNVWEWKRYLCGIMYCIYVNTTNYILHYSSQYQQLQKQKKTNEILGYIFVHQNLENYHYMYIQYTPSSLHTHLENAMFIFHIRHFIIPFNWVFFSPHQ